jgi:nucleotide-binding universal stress UspA family protein
MFRKILVGVDGDAGGRDAVALSKKLLQSSTDLTLAHIHSEELHKWLASPAEPDSTRRTHVTELLRAASEEAGVSAALRGRGLHELCEIVEADLLVVGSSRRGVLGRVLLGDDTHAALNGAPCAIAIAPGGYAESQGRIKTIGVAYNGSPESEHALAVARGLATETDAKLSALEVVSLSAYALMGGPAPLDGMIEDLVRDALARVAALGDIEPHAVYGVAAEDLAVYSSSVDLLIVGSRGYGPIGRLIHGSTSEQLARVARCPLLVLTRSSHPQEGPVA